MAGMEIVGSFELYSGDELVAKGRNKWTRFFMSSLMQYLHNSVKHIGVLSPAAVVNMGYNATSRVGTNTSTETTPDMTDIVSKIDIAPSSVARRLWKDTDIWLYVAEYVFTWDSGVLPDTEVGEFGVYLYLDDDSWDSPLVNANTQRSVGIGSSYYAVAYSNPAQRLAARIASADGAFGSFYHYGSVEPLTLVWRFQVIIQ